MPPGNGQRHNITINEWGDLVVTLMLGRRHESLIIEEGDIMPVDKLANEIKRVATR